MDQAKGAGWVVFASIMMVVAGVGNFIWGIAAVTRHTVFTGKLFFAHYTFWGVLFIVVGAVLALAGFAVLNKVQWARVYGIVFASLSLIFYFMVMWAFPEWSLVAIFIDVLVIYGLAAYGGTEEQAS